MDTAAGSQWDHAHPLQLSGYVVLCELGPGLHARTCKVHEKPHRDVPPFMDGMEPCYALKCIDLSGSTITAEGRQRAVQEMQRLLNLQHANLIRCVRPGVHYNGPPPDPLY
jgi:hypothetical protein